MLEQHKLENKKEIRRERKSLSFATANLPQIEKDKRIQ